MSRSPEFWMNLQQSFELGEAKRVAGTSVRKIRPREDVKVGHAARG